MTVRQLIEDLEQVPPDAEVGFEMNGIWPASQIVTGHMQDAPVPYVLIQSVGSPGKHYPVVRRESE